MYKGAECEILKKKNKKWYDDERKADYDVLLLKEKKSKSDVSNAQSARLQFEEKKVFRFSDCLNSSVAQWK